MTATQKIESPARRRLLKKIEEQQLKLARETAEGRNHAAEFDQYVREHFDLEDLLAVAEELKRED